MENSAYDFALRFSPYLLIHNGKVSEVSEAWLKITGYDKTEVLAQSIQPIWKSLFGFEFKDLQSIDMGRKYLIYTGYNRTKYIKVFFSVISEQETVIVFEDEKCADMNKIDELKQKLREKDEFLSHISHEIRTPLTVINSAIQVLQQIYQDELSNNAKRHISKIKQNSLRLLRLVNHLLEFTRANEGHIKINKSNMDIVFITRAIMESIAVYAQQKQIKLNFITHIQEKIIAIDEEKYERILLNLLSNAIKFTPKGKSVFVSISLCKNYVCISVKDEGIGIPKNKQSEIFNRFGQVNSLATRQEEGTGIGLSIVKSLVLALGGDIFLESTEGKGSTFTVLLPDERVENDTQEMPSQETIKNNLILTSNVEFADIYQ